MEKEDVELLVFINRSSYRVKVLKSIGASYKMPKDISKDTGLMLNHVSFVLRLLDRKNIVECINPEFKKGRFYRLTEKPLELLDYIEYIPNYKSMYEKYGFEEDNSSDEDSSVDNDSPDDGE